MNRIVQIFTLITGLCAFAQSNAQVSPALDMACRGDVALTRYVLQLIENGSSSERVVSAEEELQIVAVLEEQDVAQLPSKDKYAAVMTACTEGRILQEKHAHILNSQ
jgi:hypothetical protein